MKKFLSIILISAWLISIPCTAFAEELSTNDVFINDEECTYIYTEQDYQNILEKEQKADEMYEALCAAEANSSLTLTPQGMMPVTKTYTIPVTNFRQEKSNWCGAACIQQTISFHRAMNGISTALPSQTEIAGKLGISSSGGASSYTMANVLNQYRSAYGYSNRTYEATNITDKSNPVTWLYSRLRSHIVNQEYAPIILIETGTSTGLYRYYQENYYCRHYNTISGIRETTDAQYGTRIGEEIQTVDPHHDARFRGKYWDQYADVYNSILLADNNGANPVLIY